MLASPTEKGRGTLRAATYIIILNGVGSVGKSSTARAIQTIITMPFLHVAMDTFIDMLPERMFGHPEGLMFEKT